MNRWPITIFQAATATERRHNVHSRAALPAVVKCAVGWEYSPVIKSRLSISQSRRRELRGVSSRLSIFSISCLGDVLPGASPIAREKFVVGGAALSYSIAFGACRTRIRLLIP